MPSRNRISETDGPATTPERSVSPETSHKTLEPTKSSPSRRRGPKSPAQQHNDSGNRIRKIHESHRGGFRRSDRLQSTQDSIANKILVAIDPVPSRDRPGPAPSPLSSQQPAAPRAPAARLRPGRPRKNKDETIPRVQDHRRRHLDLQHVFKRQPFRRFRSIATVSHLLYGSLRILKRKTLTCRTATDRPLVST